MMRPTNDAPVVYQCVKAIDFRAGMHTLSVLVEGQLALDPFSKHLFAFRNRRRTSIKALYWENNGFCLWQKKLEAERFHWPKSEDGEANSIRNGPAISLLRSDWLPAGQETELEALCKA
jgi:transposase